MNIQRRIGNEHASKHVYLVGHGINDHLYELLASLEDVAIYEVVVDDWDKSLSPWKSDGFSGEGKVTLDALIASIHTTHNYIVGYSLAGMFSLWAYIETGLFEGCASCSGSLWFEGFEDYFKTKTIPEGKVYLSLGGKEAKTKHPLMMHVETITKNIHQSLKSKGMITQLNMQPGGHFTKVDERIYEGIAWLMK